MMMLLPSPPHSPKYFQTHPAVLILMRINRVLFSVFLNSRVVIQSYYT